MSTIGILLPTYNEEGNISQVIEDINKIKEKNWEIVLVDGGSSDNTVKIAKQKGAKILEYNQRGKGRAVAYAFDKLDYDYLIIMDADLTYPAEEIKKMLTKLREDCDVVVGSRFDGKIEEGAMKGLNRIGNIGLTLVGSILYQQRTGDLCSGMRGFTKKAYKKMLIDAPHFEVEANFFAEAAKKKLKSCEVPIEYRKRGGQSKLTAWHGIRIGMYLLTKRF